MPVVRILLASGSPRRHELLASMGVEFEVEVPDVDESVHPGETPGAYVERVARSKAAVVLDRLTLRQSGGRGIDHRVVIAADTTVELDGSILAKPADAVEAGVMLMSLSGRTHRVLTGLVVVSEGVVRCKVVTTEVEFDHLEPALVDWYVATGEPLDKAGAYAIQGSGGVLVRAVRGSVSNVVGLPLAELRSMLLAVGARG